MVISREYVIVASPFLYIKTGLTRFQQSILVDATGHARITDFGLATIIRNFDCLPRESDNQDHAVRWSAPEILDGGASGKESDVFSFAMVMIEVRHGWVICEL